MENKIIVTLFYDGNTFEGSFNPATKKYEFDDIRFEHISNFLQIRKELDDGSFVLSYTFQSSYLPRLFNLQKGEPIKIKDFLDEKLTTIEIKLKD